MKNEERLEKIVELVMTYGPIDGAHHKDWVLQEILETAQGEPLSDEDLEELEWERGVAP